MLPSFYRQCVSVMIPLHKTVTRWRPQKEIGLIRARVPLN